MKNTMKKIIFISCIISILLTLCNTIYAVDFSQADSWLQTAAGNSALEDLGDIGTEFSSIGNFLVYIGIGVLVAATTYMGILYIVSTPEKQAKLKEQLIGLLVSAVVIFGAYGIWQMVINILGSATGTV